MKHLKLMSRQSGRVGAALDLQFLIDVLTAILTLFGAKDQAQ